MSSYDILVPRPVQVSWTEPRHLASLGAVEVIDRAAWSAPGKPLQKERWAGVFYSVGSHTLANVAAQTRRGGTVTACGRKDIPASVAPFILRSVRLIGIDSAMLLAAAGSSGSRTNWTPTNWRR